MPTFLFFFFFLILLLLCCTPSVSCYTPSPLLNRRTLHQPFFPLISQPPANPPSPSPWPKYPSSTTPLPFFPLFPSPPPPPLPPATTTTSSLPDLPANISSLIIPISNSSPPRSPSKKLVPAIVLPILSLALLGLALAFFLRRRRRHPSGKPSRAESDRLFPANAAASDGSLKLSSSSAPASSEFLYLGTVVNSRGGVGVDPAAAAPPAADPSYRRLDSPELQPLPPLSRHIRQGEGHAEPPRSSSEEEFYSPRVSSARKENPGGAMGAAASASRRAFPAAVMEKCGSDSSTLSAPSYRSSYSASSPTPSLSSPSSASTPGESTDGGAVADAALRPHAQPPPRPPPWQLTPSPPKRKSPSPSPPSSPLQKDSNLSLVAPQRPPRPPPPPPPAGRFWEAKASKVLPCEPPALVSPRTMGLRSMAAVHPAESPKTSNAGLKDREEAAPRPKLKPLHWDKVRASSDREMVWDQLKSSSFQLNEEMIESLFVCNGTNASTKEAPRWPALSLAQENRVLDPKKSQNIAILLRALNLTKEEVCEALLEGNTDTLGTELLQTLLKMAPSKEEELKLKLKEYKDNSPFKLDPAEKFLKAVLDIPFAFKRVDAMLYIANFESEISYLRKSFDTVLAACEELRSSRIFTKLLEAVLKTGNRMNVGTNRGDAHAFKLDTLLKLVDIKGADSKTTLLHFVVQEIIRAEGSRLAAANQTISSSKNHTCTLGDDLECKKLGLLVVAGLGGELSNVKKAAAMDSEVLTGYVSKLARGVGKVNEAFRLNGSVTTHESGQRFHETMHGFLKEAQEEIIRIQSQEHFTLSLVKETTEYFHGNAAEEEAHPFRIFMIVRDFLSILDQVCKEVGKINERTMVGSAQQFPAPGNPMLPPLFPKFHSNMAESSDEDDCSLSS